MASSVSGESPEIDFLPLKEAIAKSTAEEKVVVAYFSAEWCIWCRKIERDTFVNADVVEHAKAMVWTKVDVDKQRQLAAQLGVRGVPAMGFFNTRGELLRMERGFISADRMIKIITELKDSATKRGEAQEQRLAAAEALEALRSSDASKQAKHEATMALLVQAATSKGLDRRQFADALEASGREAWPALVEAMADERLAVRAAAYELLQEMSEQSLPFDAFAEASVRDRQVEAWQNWVLKQMTDSNTSQPNTETPVEELNSQSTEAESKVDQQTDPPSAAMDRN